MSKSAQFLDAIRKGSLLTSDGATGTNLLQRGLPPGTPSDIWTLKNPQAVIGLHQDFIQAGANILLTNTFGAKSNQLARFGLENKVNDINICAVELARKAINDKEVFVAGSIGPIGQLLKPYGPLEKAEVENNYREQVMALVKAGVDLIVIETQYDLEEAQIAIQVVRSITDLPLVCSFSFDRGVRTMMGVKPRQVGEVLSKLEINLIGINCGRSIDENLAALKEMRSSSNLPIWFKPNAGLPKVDDSDHPVYTITPEDMAASVPQWIASGAQVIGGCCGTSPAHLEKIHQALTSTIQS